MKGEVPFGRWLQRRRKELDLTQDELALQIGCATSTLQKMEAGRRRPSPEFAGRLAEILDVDLDKRQAFIRFARGSANPAVFDLFRPPTNLPAQSTPLIGREEDVAAVRQRLLNDDTRLVTLVGPPGIGKTRLSLEVAAEARDHFQDGVYFVPLAPVTDVSLIAPAIIRALNLRLNGRVPPLDYLCGYLRFKRMLLLLDNFEQVMAATDQVVQLLAACPPLKLLITSRMPLHLRAERQYPVPPLAIPDLDRLPPVDELARYGAVALFADRAEALKPGFAITPGNAPAVAAICCRLDGLPLAIELVSARIKILSPAELLNRLDAPLVLHSNGMRDADPRQHTLAQAISSSYDLLSPEEQALFARLAVHVGGWTLEAAEFGQSYLDSPAFSATLDELASLVDKSLVIQISEDGRTRFTMLETIRQYALDQLRLSGQV